jgi:hypothetical protein
MTQVTVSAVEESCKTTARMDTFDRDILTYVMLWEPHRRPLG